MKGVGGRRYFNFKVTDKAVSGTECYIGFTYARPWIL